MCMTHVMGFSYFVSGLFRRRCSTIIVLRKADANARLKTQTELAWCSSPAATLEDHQTNRIEDGETFAQKIGSSNWLCVLSPQLIVANCFTAALANAPYMRCAVESAPEPINTLLLFYTEWTLLPTTESNHHNGGTWNGLTRSKDSLPVMYTNIYEQDEHELQ